jgi:hypothetical protein
MDMETFGKGADATKALAETAGKAFDQTAGFMKALEGPFRHLLGIYDDKIQQRRWKNQILLIEDAQVFMRERGLAMPTREIPLKFGVPLVESASLEEDEDLRKIWARLLVNAGDASTPMEPRPAFVKILSSMSTMDVRLLGQLVEASLANPPGFRRAIDVGKMLNGQASGPTGAELPPEVSVSLANLASLGCALPGGGFDASVVFGYMTVTELGIALFKACS